MRIGLNLMGEQPKKAGPGRYIYELMLNLSKIDHDNQYVVFLPISCRDAFYFEATNFKFVSINTIFSGVVFRRIFEQIVIPILFFKYNLELLHSSNNVAPILLFSKNTLTVHDMARWKVKNTANLFIEPFMKALCYLSIKFSGKILTVSSQSKKDILEITGISESKIDIVLEGVDTELFKKTIHKETLEIYQIKNPYIFMHGTLESRKNHINLIKAWHKSNIQEDLVLVGKVGQGGDKVLKLIEDLKAEDRVLVLDYIPDSDLIELLSNAKFFVFPTLLEGVGLPVLEAMACGVPVLTSDIPVMHDYADGCALYVDPEDVNNICDGLKRLSEDSNLRAQLVKNSRDWVQKFTWDKCAENTLRFWKDYAYKKA